MVNSCTRLVNHKKVALLTDVNKLYLDNKLLYIYLLDLL